MTIWMVTGLHDARWLPNVLSNFERQSYSNARLLLVENGDGYNALTHRPDYCFKLSSGSGPSASMNEAIDWLLLMADKNDWFCKCDADDYYGPNYLTSVEKSMLCGFDFSGQKSIYLRTRDNKLWFLEGNQRTVPFHGPTIACRVRSALPFPVVKDWGEDTLWCQQMLEKGKRGGTRRPEGFCYQRWEGYKHTWPCTDDELRTAWPLPFQACGEFDERVINGEIERKVAFSLPAPAPSLDNSMPVRVLLEGLKGKPMKTIAHPNHVVQSTEESKVGFAWFVTYLINNDNRFNGNAREIRSAMRIESEVKRQLGPTVEDTGSMVAAKFDFLVKNFTLEEEDWERLKMAAEEPSCGYPTKPARASLPWVEAIVSAT